MTDIDPSRPTNDPWLERSLIGRSEEEKRKIRVQQALAQTAVILQEARNNETGEQNG